MLVISIFHTSVIKILVIDYILLITLIMSKHLVIVESPTKAKTIKKFLGKDYTVESSFGHIRDLPKKELGIDVDNNFEPTYIVPDKSEKTIDKLQKLADKADIIYFATDEDREGEAISWHLIQLLHPEKNKIKRIVFHEITKKAILEAIEHPRDLDDHLVDAQQARRVLDRLVGYKLSPFLWKKIARGLSAGRVQSVAVRLIVEREREIQAFKPKEYWSINGLFSTQTKEELEATLSKTKSKALKKFDIKNKEQAQKLVDDIKNQTYTVGSITSKKSKKSPKPPFRTSTLQQSASSLLNFSPKQTMRIAQQLYEGIDVTGEGQVGLITYMRTDSFNLSEQFLQDAAHHITHEYGKEYYSGKARVYKTNSKGAQEAHEAIRPTHVEFTPDMVRGSLDDKQFKLYRLIWQRAIASQMTDAQTNSTTIEVESINKDYTFKATGSIITFDGYLKIYPTETKDTILPNIKEKDNLKLNNIEPKQHFTQPPARYSEATLVKALEEYGIGRPSTYAPTISTIQDRNYVKKEEDKRLHPTDMAYVVTDLLVNHFHEIIDYKFTAEMEQDLDDVADGKKKWQNIIKNFYQPFEKNLEKKDKELDKKKLTEEKTDEKCPECTSPMVIKIGRFGKFMACSNYPECKTTQPIPGSEEAEQEQELSDETCEKCGKQMAIKTGRYGKFLGCSGYPECKNIKSIVKSTNVSCPQCKKGEIVEKRTKRGKIFFACNQYPDCEFALWSKPTGELCPDCKSLLVYGAKETIRCSNKECKYKA